MSMHPTVSHLFVRVREQACQQKYRTQITKMNNPICLFHLVGHLAINKESICLMDHVLSAKTAFSKCDKGHGVKVVKH